MYICYGVQKWHLNDHDLSGPGGREEKNGRPVWSPLPLLRRCPVNTESRQKWDSECIRIWLKADDGCRNRREEEKEFLIEWLTTPNTSWWACISRCSNTAAAEKRSKVLVNETAIWACTHTLAQITGGSRFLCHSTLQYSNQFKGWGQPTKTDEFSEKFQKGGGSFSIQKFILQNLDL